MVENRLNELSLWYTIDDDGVLTIKMPVRVSYSDINFKCPFCVTKYKHNFSRFKHSKPISHRYFRRENDIENLGIRVPLCKKDAYLDYDLPPFQFELICMSTTLSFK